MRKRVKLSEKRREKFRNERESFNVNVADILGKGLNELKARFKRPKESNFGTIEHASNIPDFIHEIYSRSTQGQESITVLYLDSDLNITSYYNIGSLGDLSKDAVMILSAAFTNGSPIIAIAHNKPDGSLEPTITDVEFNNRIKGMASLTEICFLDHVIITKAGYYSFSASGKL